LGGPARVATTLPLLNRENGLSNESDRRIDDRAGNRHRAARRVVSLLSLVALIACAESALAQAGTLGAYEGTVTVSGTETGKYTQATYRATLKVRLPLATASSKSAHAEVDDVDKPSASAVITQWDTSGRNSSPDSDGKISTWTCKLSAPTEVPLNGSGMLDVDYRAKTHAAFVTYVGTKPIPLNCVSSRSGAYKQTQAVALFFGTNEPDVPENGLPFADPAHLTATYTLVPASQMKGRNGPQAQTWDLHLVR
jgi:hypothetical protein